MSTTITAQAVIERARRAMGHGCRYALGKGGMYPFADLPWGEHEAACDCSGFVAWCLKVSRKTDVPWYVQQNGGWFETTAIARDAKSPFGFVEAIPHEVARPGDLLVYGDSKGRQGHVGLVSAVNADGPLRAIHCSMGNWRRTGDAIQETDTGLWLRPDALVCRVAWVTEG